MNRRNIEIMSKMKPEIKINFEKDFYRFNDTIGDRYFYNYYRIFVIFPIILKLK